VCGNAICGRVFELSRVDLSGTGRAAAVRVADRALVFPGLVVAPGLGGDARTGLRLALPNWVGLDGKKLREAGLKGRCLIDFARMQAVVRKEMPQLIGERGVEAIAFGSHAPFDYAGPSLLKRANLERLPAVDFERIAWRNTVSFFGIEG
jgi:hypothetical protein